MFRAITNPGEGADRLIVCQRVVSRPLLPSRDHSLGDCEICDQPVWLSPNVRRLIVEFEHYDYTYKIACDECIVDLAGRIEMEIGDIALAANRLSLLRGATPRGNFAILREADMAAVRDANPHLRIRTRKIG